MLGKKMGLLLIAAALTTGATTRSHGLAAPHQKTITAPDLTALLDKAGYNNYTRVDDGVWEIQFKGKNIPEFAVRIALSEDVVLIMAKLADKKRLVHPEQLFQKLLELNDKMDTVKFALSSEMLYVRIELHTRLLDEKELQYAIDQISAAVDQSYPQIKPFLPGSK